MRKCSEILSRHDCKIQIVTRSGLVVRDVDFLKKVSSMVTLTIAAGDDNVSRILEPHAPSPSERIETAGILVEKGTPVSVRVDPLIPFVNDNPEKLVETLASIGVRHVTSSTYKIKPDNWRRFSVVMPKTAEKLRPLYFEKGEKIQNHLLTKRVKAGINEKIGCVS
jgi:DNA repair photolyase